MVLLVMMGGGGKSASRQVSREVEVAVDSINAKTHAAISAGIAEWRQEQECRYKEICSRIARTLVLVAGYLHEAKFPEYSIVTGVTESVRAGILMVTIDDIMSVARDIALNACNSLKLAAPSATLDGILCTQTPRDDAAHVAGMPRTEHSRAQSAEEKRQEQECRHKEICSRIARIFVSMAGDLYEIRHPGQDIVIGVPKDVRAAVLLGTLFYIASDAIGIAWNACLSLRGAGPSATLDDILFAPAQQAQGAAL